MKFSTKVSAARQSLIAGPGFCWCLAVLVPLLTGRVMAQQSDGFQPLNQHLPPGQAAAWLNTIRGYDPSWMQPIRIELPTGGSVSIYSASTEPNGMMDSPAQFGVNAGHLYRLRLSNMPEFPGEEVFPSVEVLDRLHPPMGLENNYPIPVVFAREDIRLAIAGKLVTRVIYLEQPQLSVALDPLRREVPLSVEPADNALHEADRLGRPMLIVRIGGRTPSEYDQSLSFYGTGGAVDLRPPQPVSTPGVARLSSPAGMTGRSRVSAPRRIAESRHSVNGTSQTIQSRHVMAAR